MLKIYQRRMVMKAIGSVLSEGPSQGLSFIYDFEAGSKSWSGFRL